MRQCCVIVLLTAKKAVYFFLCLSFLKRFLRLCVDILCLLCFLPFGIIFNIKMLIT